MKFTVSWSINPAHRRDANARFLETGGGPPDGIEMLGRWHGGEGGFVLAETGDVKALYEWLGQWNDLLDFKVTPVMDDADAAEVIKKISS